MPELPEVEALAAFLTQRAVGRTIATVWPAALNALKTYDPPPSALAGLEVTGVRRSGKFLDIVQGSKLLNYDIELSRYNTVGTDLSTMTSWLWLDDYHLIVTDPHDVRMMDFDGQNDQVISAVTPLGIALVNKDPLVLAQTSTTTKLSELELTLKH